MKKFMIEETFTSEACSGIMSKPEDRYEALKPLFESAGCKLEQFYLSGIENKSYLIVESNDLKSVYAVMAHFLAGNAASSVKCIPLLTIADGIELFKKAAGLTYRPPGK